LPGFSFSIPSGWQAVGTYSGAEGSGTLEIKLTPTSVLPPPKTFWGQAVDQLNHTYSSSAPARPMMRLTLSGIGNPIQPSDHFDQPGQQVRTIPSPAIPGVPSSSRQMIIYPPFDSTEPELDDVQSYHITKGRIYGNPDVLLEVFNTRNSDDPAVTTLDSAVEQVLSSLRIPYHLFAAAVAKDDRTWGIVAQIAGNVYLGAIALFIGSILFYPFATAKRAARLGARWGSVLFCVVYGHLLLAILATIGSAAIAIISVVVFPTSIVNSYRLFRVTSDVVMAISLTALFLVGNVLWHRIRSYSAVEKQRSKLGRRGDRALAITMQAQARRWITALLGPDTCTSFDQIDFVLTPELEMRSEYWGTVLVIGIPFLRLFDSSQLAVLVKREATKCHGSWAVVFNCLDTMRRRIAVVRAGSEALRLTVPAEHPFTGSLLRRAMSIGYWRCLWRRFLALPDSLFVSVLTNCSRWLLEPWCKQVESVCDEQICASIGATRFAEIALRVAAVEMAWQLCPPNRKPNGTLPSTLSWCAECWERGCQLAHERRFGRQLGQPSLATRMTSVGCKGEEQRRILESLRLVPEHKPSPHEMPSALVADIERALFENAVANFGH